MEDIFDNLLYIIITIAAFAISAISKKRKQQARKQSIASSPENSENKKPSYAFNIEKLIKDEMGFEDERFISDIEHEEEVTNDTFVEEPIDTVPKHLLDDKEDVPYSIEYDESELITNSSISDNDITDEDISDVSVLDDFNLESAIIYSEIINRKEY